ncbi:MAG: hypothetical protein P8X88_06915 [Gammaproteobacteria bacterium]
MSVNKTNANKLHEDIRMEDDNDINFLLNVLFPDIILLTVCVILGFAFLLAII